ncbi:MAG TPA: hypothetical protein VKW08_13345 [Xanthobacteraceae bacterium]|nr:hypothetical protein [Xanthobacteraceae bacterium]
MNKIMFVALYIGLAGPPAAWSLPTDETCKSVAFGSSQPFNNALELIAHEAVGLVPSACPLQKSGRGHIQAARLDGGPSGLGWPRLQGSRTEYDDVIASYNQRLMLDPRDDDAYFRRGIANFYAGSIGESIADIEKAHELDPSYPYYPMWLGIIGGRSGMPSHLAEEVSHLDMTKWPAPIIRLLLGQLAVSAVLAAADDPDTTVQAGQICEANFYIGQLDMLKSSVKEAEHRFRLAAIGCPQDFVEGPAARAELKALGAGR